MKFALFSAVLLVWMRVGESGDPRGSQDCCLTVSETRIPAENIVKYDMQETAFCPLRAVRFLTKKSKTICSDPESKWAKRVMEIVDQRTTTKPIIWYTSTTNTIPTATATQKTSTEDGPPVSCCLKLGSSRVPLKRVLNYRIQNKGLCPIKAVVIQTVSGKSLCSDPNSSWTKRAVMKVDEEREQDPVLAGEASVEESRGRVDPVPTTELPLKRRRNRVNTRQESKPEKSKMGTKAHKGPKGRRSERGGVKGKNKKGKNCRKCTKTR